MQLLRRAKDEQRRAVVVERARRVLVAVMLAIGAVWIGAFVLAGAYMAAWMLATGDVPSITIGERRTSDGQQRTAPPWDSPPPVIAPPPPGESESRTIE